MPRAEPIYSQRPQALPFSYMTITIDVDRQTLAEIDADLCRWERLYGEHAAAQGGSEPLQEEPL